MSAPPADPLHPALAPQHSAVVEACAGSGKTWLLVSRMVRLLLAGAAPGELLAITFTRQAAGEMRDRLETWLRDLALLPEAEALAFLRARGLDAAAAQAALPRARGLLEAVLAARPGPFITTFHGWFFHLLAHAPLSVRPAGEVLEHPALLRDAAWQQLSADLLRAPQSPAAAAFRALVAELPLTGVRGLVQAFMTQAAAWWARQERVADNCAALARLVGVDEDADPLAELFAQPGLATDLATDLATYQALEARQAAAGLAGAVARAARLSAALDDLATGRHAAAFEALCAVLLTQAGEVRSNKPSAALERRLRGDSERYLALHAHLGETLRHTRARLAEQRGLRLNRQGLTLALAYQAVYTRLKAEQGALDFTDAEQETARLLADETLAAAVYAKLDARWRHVLLDEFQDANPLQWGILRAWLAAYGSDAGRPTVFMVGDPKQSIYRFRRAEPRLFGAAGAWLGQHYQAGHYHQNLTRRCAPRVVAWLNATFAHLPDYPGFAAHTASQADLPGWCELHLAPAGQEDATPAAEPGPRRPLATPAASPPPRRGPEAAWLAARIQAVVGRLMVQDDPPRPARHGDIMVLYAKRTELEVFESALRAAGIPFRSDQRGGLLDTLEARDLEALLTSLLDPHDDLALAHALKSPLFGVQDAHLQHLAAHGEGPWRARLADWAGQPGAPAAVTRAAHLLHAWQAQVGTLPVHDLLDSIYDLGEVSARYAAALHPTQHDSVRANLDGFLAQALALSGARYPSLARFLDELRLLRDKAGRDAPDQPPQAHADTVRLFTIHGAKGLEAPVVFLIKADNPEGREDGCGVLIDWPPEAERPRHFSLYGPRDWRGPGRDALFRQEQDLAAVENLNLLYVAITRARQALFVSGLAGKAAEARAGHWLDHLQRGLQALETHPAPQMRWITAPGPAPVAHPAPARPTPAPLPRPVGSRRAAQRAEARHGTRLHAWLEQHTQGRGAQPIAAQLALHPAQAALLAAQAARILTLPELAPAFDPERHLHAVNELEFIDAAGRSARIDRLVVLHDAVWVLDYKSGGLDEPDLGRRAAPHAEQMQRYRQAAGALYPGKAVHSALVFADGQVFWQTDAPRPPG